MVFAATTLKLPTASIFDFQGYCRGWPFYRIGYRSMAKIDGYRRSLKEIDMV